ncbi:Non-structural maintenance of chromosomes element 1 [Artemisia annua]|uniref:Non-structural maintenance of chromosomes element 1 homolog n=1 Tax=Artemisia annua TaxID=35608 RepID=A0A2U1KFF0_ARTAN|nr:Non-structural maintenance of chromosomes element 1 [Artemisia annua]
MAPLSWRQHTLIQALLSRGPLKEHDFLSIFADVTGKSKDSHQQLFNDYLRKINMELSYVQFELRACRNQYDGCVYYGVINTVSDEQSKLGTKYTVPQIAFYKAIIEAIVQDSSAQGAISNIEALNLRLENQALSSQAPVPTALKNFSMSQKDKALQEFVQDQWLCDTTDGKIGLGVRSFLDLRSWFHNNEVPPCDVCNEAGIKADLCPNDSCNVRIHQYCLKAKFSSRNEKVCPGCGTQWPYFMTKAEAVEEEDTDINQPPPEPLVQKRSKRSRVFEENGSNSQEGGSNGSSQVHSSSRKRPRSSQNTDEESTGPSQSQPMTQAARRAKVEALEDLDEDNAGPSQVTRRATRKSTRLQR